MGFKMFKTYNEGSEDEVYDSPEENDEENDFYYLKRKEDQIAEFIMENYIEISYQVISKFSWLQMAEFKLEWSICFGTKGIIKNKTTYFRFFQKYWDNWSENSFNCLYPYQNQFTQDLGYLTMKEQEYIKNIRYLNVQMVFPAI